MIWGPLPIATLPVGLAGLVVPGYLVATALRTPAAWAAAMPLSSLFICLGITFLQVLGIPLTFAAVGALLATVSAVGFAVCRYQTPCAVARAEGQPQQAGGLALGTVATLAMMGFVAATTAAFTLRVALFPLSGFDTLWRWEYLARLMLEHKSLAFYPPRSAADYEIYFYPDGIAPLVSGVYWWLYAAAGRPVPMITALAVVGQLASIGGLVHAAASRLWGEAAGWPAVALLFATPLFISAVAIGQETGFTAVSVAGQLLCAIAARQQGSARLAIAAGLFAGVGALARDYGLAFVVVGGLVLAEERRAWRLLPAYMLAAIACTAPWYLRNWALTGNPVFSNPTPLGLLANPVHERILGEYRALLGLTQLSSSGWIELSKTVLTGAGPLLAAGLTGAAVIGRRIPAIVVSVLLVISIWAWSVGFTAGGLNYSLRVLSPAWVMLAIAAAAIVPAGLAVIGNTTVFATCLAAAAVGWGSLSLASTASHPLPLQQLSRAVLATRSDPIATHAALARLAAALDRSRIASCRVLTDDTYFAAVLNRTGSRFRPLMVWSPTIAKIFDTEMSLPYGRELLADTDAPLVCIGTDDGSLNWRYLRNVPFFKIDMPTWKRAFQLGDAAIRSMPSVKPLSLLPD